MEKQSSESTQHPEIEMRKEKIFKNTDLSKRKTKIVCTLG
jgi:hypothetical protein